MIVLSIFQVTCLRQLMYAGEVEVSFENSYEKVLLRWSKSFQVDPLVHKTDEGWSENCL